MEEVMKMKEVMEKELIPEKRRIMQESRKATSGNKQIKGTKEANLKAEKKESVIHADEKKVIINGSGLTVFDVVAVAREFATVEVSAESRMKMQKSREYVEALIQKEEPVYGINTGFGDFSKIRIAEEELEELQKNLIISHAVGVGEPYAIEIVRAMMLLRVNALSSGFSGIRPEVVETLVKMLNKKVHPVIPQQGSLGASGDLIPLAHMALPIIGRGEAYYEGEILSGQEAMKRAGIPVCTLAAKEGLALINGTQAMAAVGSLAYYDALMLSKIADITGALTIEALSGLLEAFDEKVQAVRPHKGQKQVAANIRNLLQDSPIIKAAKGTRVQDAYALRCIPQVHGAVRDALRYVGEALSTEINSVTDNPILFIEEDEVISGGNFHGEPLALAFDFLGIAVAELASISERRLERLVNPALSQGLPAFLANNGGLNSGFMIIQYGAASLVSENKVYAHPASVDSIPSSANQEDHVSMGTTAARKARKIVENSYHVLAYELMAAALGIDFRNGEQGMVTKKIHDKIRSFIPFLEKDRELRNDVKAMGEWLHTGELVKLVEDCIPLQ